MNLYSISGLKNSGLKNSGPKKSCSNKALVSGPADSASDVSVNVKPSEKSATTKSRYWRSLSELQDREDFQQYIDREFPVAASEFPEGVSRRRWMQLMGASLAVAGATGCRYPEETIAPFVIRPEGRVPGESYSRATNFELASTIC